MNDYDVAIVGYGPTGMTLAALLGQLGRRVVVLERYAGLYNLPRAACFDDEIMRTFQKLGLVAEISRGAEVQRGTNGSTPLARPSLTFSTTTLRRVAGQRST